MSFILDALKKSELERQRQSVPGLMDARPPPRNKQLPFWAAALCALLAVNLLVLTFVLTRKSAPAAQVARAPGPEAQAAAQPDAEHFSPLDPAPVYAPEIPVGNRAPRLRRRLRRRRRVRPPARPVTRIRC
jgi:general secretion pathway protein B